MTVAQHDPPIDGTSEARSQYLREQHRRPVSYADKDKALKDRVGVSRNRWHLI